MCRQVHDKKKAVIEIALIDVCINERFFCFGTGRKKPRKVYKKATSGERPSEVFLFFLRAIFDSSTTRFYIDPFFEGSL